MPSIGDLIDSGVLQGGSVTSGGPTAAPISDSGDTGDWGGYLSGLGDLFQGLGAGIASGIKASNSPTINPSSGWVYNAATGNYINPATGQAMTATGTLPSAGGLGALTSSPVLLLGLGLIAVLLIRKKG